MILKSISSLCVALLIWFLHLGCCLIPLLAATAGLFPSFAPLMPHKTVFTLLQLSVFIYISIRLARYYFWRAYFHSRLEKRSFQFGFLIAVASLLMGYYEPLKTEEQRIAQQQFAFFKTHRNLQIRILGDYDSVRLQEDILLIKGVKTSRIQIPGSTYCLTFQSKLVSKAEILFSLRQKGYKLALQDELGSTAL
ncbi:hypothetical protein [Dyadobacter psychrotolerans]|uniref:Uncharacterized protein n=1 Tax=Dyadobacter psychrotolerans TaxID=2541721 RepID=A0A4V2Z300_9BACT|nr:hypothetical protein [Dyadobacter psychrotolerans]TDE10838.1 hypothetical protein E0F88_27580 [Dyadobacter psychrotolerans]